MEKLKKYNEFVNEGRVIVKRQYTENHPARITNENTKIRNKVFSTIGDKIVTEEQLNKILKELNAHSKWIKRNATLFKVDENGISLSKSGKKIHSTIAPKKVNENIEVNESFAAAGAIILAVMGFKAIKKVVNDILGNIGSHIKVEPDKLKEVVNSVSDEAIQTGITGDNKSKIEKWKDELLSKIDKGLITTFGELEKNYILIRESEVNEGYTTAERGFIASEQLFDDLYEHLMENAGLWGTKTQKQIRTIAFNLADLKKRYINLKLEESKNN